MHDPTKSRYRYLKFASANSYRRYILDDEKKTIQKSALIPHDQSTPAHGSYAGELFKPEWQLKRKEILDRDGHCCVICRKAEELQVHHRQYYFIVKDQKFRLPWEYPDHLLITLCESCHRRGHSKYKVPIINI